MSSSSFKRGVAEEDAGAAIVGAEREREQEKREGEVVCFGGGREGNIYMVEYVMARAKAVRAARGRVKVKTCLSFEGKRDFF